MSPAALPSIAPEQLDLGAVREDLMPGITLRPYQREGAAWLGARSSGLLGDTMGLGKTPQAIAALPERGRAIVICPAVAKGVWERHVKWRSDLFSRVLKGRKQFDWPVEGEVTITSWDSLPFFLDDPERTPPMGRIPLGTTVIYDEVHYGKNPDAARSRRARVLGLAARVREGRTWGLSGTPLKTREEDLWNVLVLLGLTRDSFVTKKRFCRLMGRCPETWEWTGSISPQVPELLRRVMLRREFDQVVKDMPSRSWDEIDVEIGKAAKKACDRAAAALAEAGVDLETATREALLDANSTPGGGELARACKVLAAAKVPALLELLDMHEAGSDEPVLVWSRHRAPIEACAQRPGWAMLTGSTSPPQRTKLEEAFQRGELRGLALTIGAGATAITLTRASWSIFVDRAWSHSDNDQAEGRTFRLGQTKPCRYTDLVAAHAIDRRLHELLGHRRAVTDASVGAATVTGEAGDNAVSQPAAGEVLVPAATIPPVERANESRTQLGLFSGEGRAQCGPTGSEFGETRSVAQAPAVTREESSDEPSRSEAVAAVAETLSSETASRGDAELLAKLRELVDHVSALERPLVERLAGQEELNDRQRELAERIVWRNW